MGIRDTDATVRLPRRAPRRWWLLAVLGGAIALTAGGAAWFHSSAPAPVIATPAPVATAPASPPIAEQAALDPGPAPAPPAPAIAPQVSPEGITLATEAEIRAHTPSDLTVFRFAPNPAILVLDFPDMASQGRMLNRIAAWAEKIAEPRDRLLNDTELAAAIRASGATPDTYYYGHDYGAAELARFFAIAERDQVVLRPEEERLRALIQQASSDPQGFGALISVPRAGPQTPVDATARAVILHHELSHGEYFTNPAYARAIGMVWQSTFTDAERGQWRSYLSRAGYDPGLEDLMINEMQAYLLHTPDRRFFDEHALTIPAARMKLIRASLKAAIPAGWLRDVTPDPSLLRLVGTAPRRRVRQGRVSTTTALAARLPPRRRRSPIAVCKSRK